MKSKARRRAGVILRHLDDGAGVAFAPEIDEAATVAGAFLADLVAGGDGAVVVLVVVTGQLDQCCTPSRPTPRKSRYIDGVSHFCWINSIWTSPELAKAAAT